MRSPLTLEFYFLLPSDGCQWLVKFLGPGFFQEDPFPAACFLWRSLRDAPGLVLSPVAAISPAAQCFCLIVYPSMSDGLCAWSAQPAPICPTSSRGGGLPSVSPGNAWLGQDGAPRPGWFLVSGVQSRTKASAQTKGWISALWGHLSNVWTPGITFCLTRHLKPCPGLHPWTECWIRRCVHSGILKMHCFLASFSSFSTGHSHLWKLFLPHLLTIKSSISGTPCCCRRWGGAGVGSNGGKVHLLPHLPEAAALWQLFHSLWRRHLSLRVSVVVK